VPKTTPLCSHFSTSPRRHRHRHRRHRHRPRPRLPLFANTLSPFPLPLLSLSLRFATRLLVPFPPFARVIVLIVLIVARAVVYFAFDDDCPACDLCGSFLVVEIACSVMK